AASLWAVKGFAEIPAAGTGNGRDLAALAVVCCFGFALCPYLDATFYRAAEALAPSRRRVAFGVGFGVVFFGMIVFTLLYAKPQASAMAGTRMIASGARAMIGADRSVPSGFTIAVAVRTSTRVFGPL